MANRSYQTITLYGKPEKIKQVFDHINICKGESRDDGQFNCEAFPESLCTFKDDNKIILETKHAPTGFENLSKLFPEVGFKSTSFTDGEGEEDIIYILGGHILYSVYISIEGPIHWKETTGNDMASVNDIVEHYINKYIS